MYTHHSSIFKNPRITDYFSYRRFLKVLFKSNPSSICTCLHVVSGPDQQLHSLTNKVIDIKICVLCTN